MRLDVEMESTSLLLFKKNLFVCFFPSPLKVKNLFQFGVFVCVYDILGLSDHHVSFTPNHVGVFGD
jgi:hypothetical protein